MPPKKKDKVQLNTIANFSAWFIKNFRVSIIILLAILTVGYLSYTRFLTREGFPAVQIPIVFIQTPYFVDDAELVDEDVTSQIESALKELSEISRVSSTTNENFSNIIVELENDLTSKEGAKLLQETIDRNAILPPNASISYQTFDAAAINGEYELMFTISRDIPILDMQLKGIEIAEEIAESTLVKKAEVIEQITTETNPITGEDFEYQNSFNRVATKRGSKLEFKNAVSIGVIARNNVGAIELSDEVRNIVENLQKDRQLDEYKVVFGGDFAETITEQISSLEKSAFGGLIAVIVILLLLVNWRASILGALFIPTVLAGTFISLYLIGYSLNVISLFALILVLGLFVDDAIVVIEAIDYQRHQGLKGIDAIKKAIHNIGPADISGTITTILVFLPMAFTTGILGQFIKMIPITVVIALIISLAMALTIIPLLAFPTISNRKINLERELTGLNKIADVMLNLWGRIVNEIGAFIGHSFVLGYLKNKYLSFGILVFSLILVVVGGSFASKLTFSVFPTPKDSNGINVSITFPEDSTINEAQLIAQDAEKIITTLAETHVDQVTYFSASRNSATMSLALTPMNMREITSQTIVERLQSAFDQYEYIDAKISQESAGPPESDYPFAMQIYGEDPTVLQEAAEDIQVFLEKLTLESNESIIEVKTDSFTAITKKDTQRFTEVKAKLSDPRNTGLLLSVQEKIENEYTNSRLSDLGLSESALGFDLGQESENLESFESALFALIIALIGIYILLVFQFNSFLQPVIILLAIPLSFPGLFPGLYATQNNLSFFVTLGIMGLVGIVVNNTIMLVDFANQAQRDGKTPINAISTAIMIRFRPIAATTATTIAGLLPLALSDPFWEGLAYSIIFGLLSSTLLVVLFFPVYYVIIEHIRDLKYLFIKQESEEDE